MAFGKKQKNPDKVGAIWVNKKDDGETYLSITIGEDEDTMKLVAFKNSYKEEDKHPDFVVYKSKPKGATSGSKAKTPF